MLLLWDACRWAFELKDFSSPSCLVGDVSGKKYKSMLAVPCGKKREMVPKKRAGSLDLVRCSPAPWVGMLKS